MTESGSNKPQGNMIYHARHAMLRSFLGQTVRMEVDRPIGYVHRKKDRTIQYPINYGYIPGVLGGDGEDLDVYLLGVTEPVSEYTGSVIGIACREDDIEDKLVMAPEGVSFTQNEIAEAIEFQEKYYRGYIDAIYHKSCGVVVWRKHNGMIEYLCLHQCCCDTWSVPKGHMEAHETEFETAKRELKEEIGCTPSFDPDFKQVIKYPISGGAIKTVVLYLAEAGSDMDISVNPSEISEFRYLPKDSACDTLPPYFHPVLAKAEEYIRCRL